MNSISEVMSHSAKRVQIKMDLYLLVLRHLESRGKFFRAGASAYYLDDVDHVLLCMDAPTPELAILMRQLSFLSKQSHTELIVKNLIDFAASAPLRELHRMSYMSGGAIYLNAGDARMIRITPREIEEVPIGTDDVVLIADDIAPWPSFEALEEQILKLRPAFQNRICTSPIAGSPTSLLTTR